MKMLLGIIGVLAFLASGSALFAGRDVTNVTGAVLLLVACTCFGFSHLISLAEAKEQREKALLKETETTGLVLRNFLSDSRARWAEAEQFTKQD